MSIKKYKGIMLDIGCGNKKQAGFVGMDRRDIDGVDIIHDLEDFPFPLSAESCLTIKGSHIIEHVKPWLTIDFFDELWRIMKPDGQLALSTPYANNFAYCQDPTHCSPYNEATFQYFDPDYPMYEVYEPKPWKIERGYPIWQSTGNLEIIMIKRGYDESK